MWLLTGEERNNKVELENSENEMTKKDNNDI